MFFAFLLFLFQSQFIFCIDNTDQLESTHLNTNNQEDITFYEEQSLLESDTSRQENISQPQQENINSLSKGIVKAKGTNEQVFAVNADNPEKSSGLAGFAVFEKMTEVASIKLNKQRTGWLLSVPNKKNTSQPISLGITNGNIFLGFHSGLSSLKEESVSTNHNIGIGSQALYTLQSLNTNKFNIALGKSSGIGINKGMGNICIGALSMAGRHRLNASIIDNTNPGSQPPIRSTISGSQNIAIGSLALSQLCDLESNFKNDNNIAIGVKSLYTMSLGNNNVAIGTGALSLIHQNSAKIFDRHRYYETLQNPDRFFSTTEYENLVAQPSNDVMVKFPFQKTRLRKGAGNIAIGASALPLFALTNKEVEEFNNLGFGTLSGCNRADDSKNSIFMLSPGREEETTGTFIANIRNKPLTYGTHHGVYVDEFDQLGLTALPENDVTILPDSTLTDTIKNELPLLEVFAGVHSTDTEQIVKYGIKSGVFTQDNSPIENLRLLLVYDKADGSTLGVDPTLLIPILLKAYQELKSDFDQYVATHP